MKIMKWLEIIELRSVNSNRELLKSQLRSLSNEPKISALLMWMIRIILPVMRTFTSSKTYGPVEFMMSVMTMDVVGDVYGKERLADSFQNNTNIC